MASKIFVLNADDLGLNIALNRAVLEGYKTGLLKSASLIANGEAYQQAVENVIPRCEDLAIGVHLNIIEGKSLLQNLSELTSDDGSFRKQYHHLLLSAYVNKEFLKQVEAEFRAQIEKIMRDVKVTHIDSHVHTHSIPPIFEIVCKLAKEYGIPQVRTQFEKPYMIPDLYKHLTMTYPINLIKLFLLNTFTIINRKNIKKYCLHTNDYLIGVEYTSMMDSLAVSYGVQAVSNHDAVVETLIHPCRYEDGMVDNHFVEYQITKNEKLIAMIQELGFEISNYKFLNEVERDYTK